MPTASPTAAGILCGRPRLPLFVAFGGQRRGDVVGKHREIDAAVHLVLITRHIEPARGGSEIRARGEIQVLAVAVGDVEDFDLV